MWTALPCIVTKVTWSAMTLECQPAIKGLSTDQNNVTTYAPLPLLVDVPIVFPSAGGFTLTLPIAIGNEILVVFSSRCIDSWYQSGGIQTPAELRMHDLSDGFAIPGPKSQPNVIPNISSTDAQLRNNAGTSFISIKPDGSISITAPTVNVVGNLVVTGDVTSGTITLDTHTHTSATPGDPTGPPVG